MYFEISESCSDGRWYWRLVAADHGVVARSEGHPSKEAAFQDIRRIVGARSMPICERDAAPAQRLAQSLGEDSDMKAAAPPLHASVP
jgi:uncharacterized protein YegP (UPF0339 family)